MSSESFIKIPSKLIFNADISNMELRVLMALIFWSGVSKDNHIKYGAEKLGAQIGIGRDSCRKALYKLEKKYLIKIKHRGNLVNESYGISNDIELTLGDGLKFLQNGGSAELGHLHLNKAGNLPLKTPDLPLNKADLPLNKAGHKDDRFKIKINLNKIPRAYAHNEPADAGRSIPNSGSAAESAKERDGSTSGINDQDRQLFSNIKCDYPDFDIDFQLVRVGGNYLLRRHSKFELLEAIRGEEVVNWMNERGFSAKIIPHDVHYTGEIVIKEAV